MAPYPSAPILVFHGQKSGLVQPPTGWNACHVTEETGAGEEDSPPCPLTFQSSPLSVQTLQTQCPLQEDSVPKGGGVWHPGISHLEPSE